MFPDDLNNRDDYSIEMDPYTKEIDRYTRLRVILWGNGNYRKHIEKDIELHWKNVDIVGVGDISIVESDDTEKQYSLRDTKRMYENGLIDGVIISVSLRFYFEVLNCMRDNRIPVYIYNKNARLGNVADGSGKTYTIFDDKVRVYIKDNIYFRIEPDQAIGYTYSRSGTINDECLNGYEREYFPKHPRITFEYDKEIREDVCILTRMWSTNYGHFMWDVLDKVILMENSGFRGKYMLFYSKGANNLINLLGIPSDRIIWIKPDDYDNVYKLETAYLPEAFNCKTGLSFPVLYKFGLDFGRRYNKVNTGNKRVYIKRVGMRKLVGVDDILKKYGFYELIPEETSIEDTIQLINGADIVISPQGANSADIVFMRDGVCLIETFSKYHIDPYVAGMARLKKLNYHMIVESGVFFYNKAGVNDREEDYTVNRDILEMAIETCMKTDGYDHG